MSCRVQPEPEAASSLSGPLALGTFGMVDITRCQQCVSEQEVKKTPHQRFSHRGMLLSTMDAFRVNCESVLGNKYVYVPCES